MLERLKIVNFALLRDTELTLKSGFTAITGETGAGKSLLVNALSFLAGSRIGAEMVGDTSSRTIVEAEFSGPEGREIFRRELTPDGRSRTFINDSPATIKELTSRTTSLIDVTAQRTFSHLLDPEKHLDFLDAFAKLHSERARLCRFQSDYDDLRRQVGELKRERDAFEKQRELIRFQLGEIESVNPQPDEDESLRAEIHRLEHFEELQNSAQRLEELTFSGEPTADGLLAQAEMMLQQIAKIDSEAATMAREFESARRTIREAARAVIEKCRRGVFEAERLEALRQRQFQLAGLARKFGGSLASVIARRERLSGEVQMGDFTFERIAALTKQCDHLVGEWRELSAGVGKRRTAASRELAKRVTASLARLGIPKPEFIVDLRRTPAENGLFVEDGEHYILDARGAETAQMLLSANPGVQPKPLNQVASGGELSRLLLALKEALPQSESEATVIFDEIDVGVSGRVAELLGRKLRELSVDRQMIAITHLPQIAALADHHYAVTKQSVKGRTETGIKELQRAERLEAIAALLSGGNVTEAARSQARNLLGG